LEDLHSRIASLPSTLISSCVKVPRRRTGILSSLGKFWAGWWRKIGLESFEAWTAWKT
jgi:hypothetical protein